MSLNPPLLSLGLISASAIGYEILLMRLFSIIQWHHFVYMIISLALLGYGISGTLVALLQKTLKRHFQMTYPLLLFLFSISSFSCFLLAQSLPFNPETILWDSQQIGYLLGIFLLLSIPFVMAASAICQLFIQYPEQIAKIYGVDLLGAGLGSMGMVILLFYIFPMTALQLIGLSGILATMIAIQEIHQFPIKTFWQNNRVKGIVLFTILTGLVFINSGSYWQLQISPYKDLSKTLNISSTQIIKQQSSPLGLLSVIESPQIPFRFAPGLSLYNTQEPLEQLGLFSDAGNMTAITRYPDNLQKLSYLDQLTSALPYHLNNIQQLLIVGAGGGSDILQAFFHKTEQIDALELNPQIIDLLSHEFAQYSGNIYLQPNVQVYAEDVRGFLSRATIDEKQKTDNGRYDLIQISLMDSFNASASGLYALHESYLYTVEALQTYLQHLNPDGYLAISRWVKTPPRDAIKMFATAVKALKQSEIQAASQHIVLIRGWQTSTLLVKKNPFNQTEIKQLKQFCQQRAFDVVWYPGIEYTETNQFNHFRQPWFYQAAKALLSDSDQLFLKSYKYDVSPATDDKPFFHQFFKWSALGELLSLGEQGGYALVEMGYIILFVTLIFAALSSIILILLPLIVYHFRSQTKEEFFLALSRRIQLFIYFFSIGLAFLFIEIAMMQKFILFLHHPIYAIPVVLTTFMIFAGLGSVWTKYLQLHWSSKWLLLSSIMSIFFLGLFYSFFLDTFFSQMTVYPIAVKIILSFLLIAPLAFSMGMPFPLALSRIASSNSTYIPWAWGINGCASVISAVLASLLAIHFGFTLLIHFALALYLLALLTDCCLNNYQSGSLLDL
ncbi:MAG: SAM-dependent methyltransferase [gamma proteobacterium symbiont of Taylorina sp.]|nr:SAM-dependent methyltransferase [gamma proteobacterium symbiont of Taylorina sp.]